MKTNRLRILAALSLLMASYGCDSGAGASSATSTNTDVGGEGAGGSDGSGDTGGSTSGNGGDSNEPSGQRCLGEDSECPDNEYCQKDPDENFGRCLPGCREGIEDPSGMGRACDPESREWVEKPCEDDSACPDGQFCDTSTDPNTCAEGCRAGETQDDKECNPDTREFEAKAACCRGGGEECTAAFSWECSGDGDVFTADATCEPNPCAPTPCENDDDCSDNEYCDADTMACAPGCRLGEGGCEDGLICNPNSRECRPQCESTEDCDDDNICDLGTNTCVAPCTEDSCGEGQKCDADTKICVDTCSVDGDDCRVGETCDPDALVCKCTVEPDSCGAERTCNAATLRCEDDEPIACDPNDPNACPNPRQVCVEATGQCEFVACNDDEDCAEGQRCESDGSAPSVCVETRDECQEQSDCEMGQVCLPARGMEGRRCADDCRVNGMCDNGDVCDAMSGQCIESCRTAGCPDGELCNDGTGLCDPIPDCIDDQAGPSLAEATAIELSAPMPVVAGNADGPTAQVGAVTEGVLCPDTKDVYRLAARGSSRIRVEVRRRDGGEAVLPFKVIGKVRDNPCQAGDDTCDAGWICEERACTATADFIEAAQVGNANRDTAIIEFPSLADTAINPVDYYINLDGLGDRLEYSITASVVTEGADGLGGACFPDAREPDNNRDLAELLRQGISEDSPITGTLCGDDKDFFAIELGAADQLRVDLALNGGDADDVELYVFREGTNQGDGLAPGNSFSNPANDDFVPGKYFIIVQSAAGGDGALDYTLSVNHRPGAVNCPDMDQSGNVGEVAANPNIDPVRDDITDIGDALGTQLAICNPETPDVDAFCFEAQPGETLGAAVVGENGGDLLVDWRSADNRTLVEGRGTVGQAMYLRFNVNAMNPTVYCVTVRAVPNMGNQAISFPYSLSIQRQAGEAGMCADEEPAGRNDIAERATELVPNDPNNPTEFTLAGGGAAVCDTERPEEDWYSFRITEPNSSICITLNNFDPAGVDFDLAMYPAQAPADSVDCPQGQNDCDRIRAINTPGGVINQIPGGACVPDANGTDRCTPAFNQAEYTLANSFEMVSRDRSIIGADAVGDYLLRVYKGKDSNRRDEGSYNLKVLVRPPAPNCAEDTNTPNGDDNQLMARDLGSGEQAICDSWICRNTSDSDWYAIDVPAGQDRTVLIEFAKETEGSANLYAYGPVMADDNVFDRADNSSFGQSKRNAGNFQCLNIKGGDAGDDRKVFIEVDAGTPSGIDALGRLDYSVRILETDLTANPKGECEGLTQIVQPVCPPFADWAEFVGQKIHPSNCWSTVTVP